MCKGEKSRFTKNDNFSQLLDYYYCAKDEKHLTQMMILHPHRLLVQCLTIS